jgi:hypothetical protein
MPASQNSVKSLCGLMTARPFNGFASRRQLQRVQREKDRHELMDIPPSDVGIGKVPVPPEGYEIARIDVVRLRRRTLNPA